MIEYSWTNTVSTIDDPNSKSDGSDDDDDDGWIQMMELMVITSRYDDDGVVFSFEGYINYLTTSLEFASNYV